MWPVTQLSLCCDIKCFLKQDLLLLPSGSDSSNNPPETGWEASPALRNQVDEQVFGYGLLEMLHHLERV